MGKSKAKYYFLLLSVISGFHGNNQYDILTPEGGYLFRVQEISDGFSRGCYGANRGFDIGVLDLYGREVIHLHRETDCCNCFIPPVRIMIPVFNNQWLQRDF